MRAAKTNQSTLLWRRSKKESVFLAHVCCKCKWPSEHTFEERSGSVVAFDLSLRVPWFVAFCCVLEQGTVFSLPSTGSTNENVSSWWKFVVCDVKHQLFMGYFNLLQLTDQSEQWIMVQGMLLVQDWRTKPWQSKKKCLIHVPFPPGKTLINHDLDSTRFCVSVLYWMLAKDSKFLTLKDRQGGFQYRYELLQCTKLMSFCTETNSI